MVGLDFHNSLFLNELFAKNLEILFLGNNATNWDVYLAG